MFARRLPLPTPRILLLPSTRALHPSLPQPPTPKPTSAIPDVQTFLRKIGRNTLQHEPKFNPSEEEPALTPWERFFALTSAQMRQLGIEPARDRRYILHWREAFRASEGKVKLEEHKRGKKVDGGERRQKEVRARRRAAENKDRRLAAENEKVEKEKAFV